MILHISIINDYVLTVTRYSHTTHGEKMVTILHTFQCIFCWKKIKIKINGCIMIQTSLIFFLKCQIKYLSSLVQVIRVQEIRHYMILNQCWPRSLSPNCVTRHPWYKRKYAVKSHGTPILSARQFIKLIGDPVSAIHNEIIDLLVHQQLSMCITRCYSHFVITINSSGIRLLIIKW